MEIRATDATMGDLEVNLRLFPSPGLIGLPSHSIVRRVLVQARPALEGGIGRSIVARSSYSCAVIMEEEGA